MKQFEVIFAFDKDYLKALIKVKRTVVLKDRICDLFDFLRVQLNMKIWDNLEMEFEKYVNESGDTRELDCENDIEIWSYPEKIYDTNSDQYGPIYTNSNTIIAKFHIYFLSINYEVYKAFDDNYKLLSLIRSSIKSIFKDFDYDNLALSKDLIGLDIEEFEAVKHIFKFIILQR